MILLHVVDIVRGSKLRTTDVWSPDTDVLVLLIDQEGSEIPSNRCGGVGTYKSRGLIGLHHFTGADWGGKLLECQKRHGFLPIFCYRLKMKLCKHLQTWAMTHMLPRLLSNLHGKMMVTFQRYIARLNDLSVMFTLSEVAWILYLLFSGSYSTRRTLRVRSSLQLMEHNYHILFGLTICQRGTSPMFP